MESKLNDYLSDLVSINSINPDLSSEGQGEYEIAHYVPSHFKKNGIDNNLEEVISERYNVSALLEGQDRSQILLMNGHLDTVGAEGIENPFTLKKDGDRLYGRGTYDMLAGCAIKMCLS